MPEDRISWDPPAADLEAGLALQAAGDAAGAARVYAALLAHDPECSDASNLLGVALAQQSRFAEAVGAIREAIRLKDDGFYHLCLGDALVGWGRLDEAAAAYRTAILCAPDNAAAHFKLGDALRLAGRLAGALAAFEDAISLSPDWMDAHLSRAVVLDLQGHTERALAAYRYAIRRWPDAAELHANVGNVLLRMRRPEAAVPSLREAVKRKPGLAITQYHLGAALSDLGQFEEAAEALENAVRLQPAFAEAQVALTGVLRNLGRLDEAQRAGEAAVAADFSRPEAHVNLGNVLYDLGRFAEAAAAYRRALGLRPGDPDATSNLGNVLYALGQLPESRALHRAALAMRPDLPTYHCNYAVALLAAGEFAEGLAAYEWRLRLPDLGTPTFDRPRWTGEFLGGRTVLLHAEQGLGDTLQFCRFAPLVAERGGRVVLLVQAPLWRLLRGMPGVAEVIATGMPLPAFDLHAPLLSLPHLFGMRAESIPAAVPYLAADPGLVEEWRQRLEPDAQLRVGLVWAGNARLGQGVATLVDRRRSMALAEFAPLGATGGVRFFSLQKGPPQEELRDPPPGLKIVDLMEHAADFADTAGLVSQLDLVITVDTSVAHLAGGLGKPVWMLSRSDACWRWLRDRSDSPWYPTMRIYRQPEPGDWTTVVGRVAVDLRRLARRRAGPARRA